MKTSNNKTGINTYKSGRRIIACCYGHENYTERRILNRNNNDRRKIFDRRKQER